MKPRNESVLLVIALLLVGAFLVSFVRGVLRDAQPTQPIVARDVPAQPAVDPPEPAARARVEVLNASNRSGLARRATEALRDAGFDVVYFGNAPANVPPDSSVVIDRTGDLPVANAVASAIGITRTRSDPDSTLLLDVTVIIGNDWPPLR